MNLAALVGRLTKDPELRYTPNGAANTTFTLAVENPYAKTEPKADFLPIVVWKQQAESCAQYLKKGHRCSVEGRIATRNYEKDGRKVYVTEIVANNVRFLEPQAQNKREEQPTAKDPFQNSGDPIDISDDDLPF